MKSNILNNEQLELEFPRNVLRITVRRQRALRAQWWFDQMRKTVNSATECRGSSLADSEQIQFVRAERPSLA